MQRSTDQGGYVLGVVLAAMTVGLLLITALLSLSFATHRAAISQQERARENRAVDGALDTALTRLRSSFATSAVPQPCAPFTGPTPELDTIDFTDGKVSGPDDVQVHLRCDEVLDTSGEASGSVWIVGDDYTNGTLTDPVDWLGTDWDWTGALGSGNEPDASVSPSLVHVGEQPLRFIGGTNVASGAAGLRSDADGEAAFLVDGEYKQGADGHLGASDECGMLDLVLSPTPRTVILDDDGAPRCGDEDAGAPNTPRPIEIPPDDKPTLPLPGCGASNVISFSPGHYDTARVTTLNQRFAGSGAGSCPGKIFNFQPGNYYFDMADASANTLTFADPTSAYIFGTLADATAAPGTASCNETAPGVKVVFSGRSTFRHLAGNVDICGNPGTPALVQSALADSEVTLSNAISNDPCSWPFAPCRDFAYVSNVLKPANGGEDARARINCFGGGAYCTRAFTVDVATEGGRQLDDIRVIWASNEVPPAHSSNRSVTAVLKKGSNVLCTKTLNAGAGRTPGFHSQVRFDPDGADCPGLNAGATEGALNGAKLTMQFSYPPNTYTFGEQLQLFVRGLEILVNADEGDASPSDVTSPTGNWTDPDAVAQAGGSFAASTEADCNFTKTYYTPWPEFTVQSPRACWRGDATGPGADDGPATLTLNGFDFGSGAADLRPTDLIDRLFVAIDTYPNPCPPPIAGSVPVDCSSVAGTLAYPKIELGSTTVDLSWTQEGVDQQCSVPLQNQTYTWSVNTYMIDLLGPDTDCAGQLGGADVALLADLEVDLTITPERGTYFDTYHPFPTNKVNRFEWVGLQVPSIDHVRLLATTSSARGVMRATITNDESAGTRFRVHGDSVLPRTSVNLRWKGTASPGTAPIFKGTLWVDSMASVADPGAQVGLVCCGDGQKAVRVIAELPDPDTPGAWIPGGVAKATLGPAEGAPGLADAVITEWEFCRADGCDIGADSVITPSP
jgi:hypothetical protein